MANHQFLTNNVTGHYIPKRVAKMKVFFSENHKSHSPKTFISKGKIFESPEKPERANILEKAARRAGHDLIEAERYGLNPIKNIHQKDYVNFLETAWLTWKDLPDSGDEIIPNVHPGRNMNASPNSIISLSGHYQADTACPIGEGTYEGIIASSDVAVSGAYAIMDDIKNRNKESYAYSLCRPPGHHAFADQAGGFCFFNNSAIAAQVCLDNGATRIAILDIDVHHGNGTQGIFYHRSDVFTISLHGDPLFYYPFFAGHADEIGSDEGTEYNLNYPLPRGTNDENYLKVLNEAVDKVIVYQPDVLIVALGLDASIADPLAFLSITTDGFFQIGKTIGSAGIPTLLIQEGGYISPVLGDNLAATLGGFEETR